MIPKIYAFIGGGYFIVLVCCPKRLRTTDGLILVPIYFLSYMYLIYSHSLIRKADKRDFKTLNSNLRRNFVLYVALGLNWRREIKHKVLEADDTTSLVTCGLQFHLEWQFHT